MAPAATANESHPSSPRAIYLDHAATTPVLPAAKAAMAAALDGWANPSSPHADGRAARAILEDARRRIGAALDWDGDIIFTSGATEAIALAIGGRDVTAVATSPVEHEAVLRATRTARRLAVDDAGRVLAGQAIDAGTMVAVQSANNETGVLQDIPGLAAEVRAARAHLFCDASQSAGKLPLPDVDLIALSGHKLGGPPGVGALLVRDLGLIAAAGGQEKGYRPGTENVPAICGLAAALEAGRDWLDEAARLRRWLDAEIAAAGGKIVAGDTARIPTIGAYAMPGVAAQAQLIRFDLKRIAVSAGSACSSGTLKASHVLEAMGWPQSAGGVIRVSFGRDTSEADVERFAAAWRAIAQQGR